MNLDSTQEDRWHLSIIYWNDFLNYLNIHINNWKQNKPKHRFLTHRLEKHRSRMLISKGEPLQGPQLTLITGETPAGHFYFPHDEYTSVDLHEQAQSLLEWNLVHVSLFSTSEKSYGGGHFYQDCWGKKHSVAKPSSLCLKLQKEGHVWEESFQYLRPYNVLLVTVWQLVPWGKSKEPWF